MPSSYITDIGLLALPQPYDKGMPSDPIRTLRNVWIEIQDSKVSRIGPKGEPQPEGIKPNAKRISAEGGLATPGFVDCHTHPVFFGTRQHEFRRRCAGESYQQIAASGGGILSSVRGVRSASLEQLTDLVRKRFDNFIRYGTTTVETKSGYGLSFDDEIKSLEAIKSAAEGHPIDVTPTLLAAHVVPPEHKGDPDRYVEIICKEIIPEVVQRSIADAVDVFLEEGAFNLKRTRRIFEAAKSNGLGIHLHADQFSVTGGAQLAAEFGALSADHMDMTDDEGIKALSDGDVSVVLLPGAVFFLGLDQYAPARKMVEQGCRVAVSTDFNPGSSPTQSMPLMMSLACINMGLTPDEALWAATLGGAYVLNRAESVGSLLPGYSADVCLWELDDVAGIPYFFGNMMPKLVIKRGEVLEGCKMRNKV